MTTDVLSGLSKSTLIISNPSTLKLSNRKFAITSTDESSYFPIVFMQEKGTRVNVSFYYDDTFDGKKRLKDIISDDNYKSENSYTFDIGKLNELLSVHTEDIVPHLVELLEDLGDNNTISPDYLLGTINILRQKYSAEYIIGVMHNLYRPELDSILESQNPIKIFEELIK